MVDALRQGGRCEEPGLFVGEGVEQEVLGIREALDSDAEFPPFCAQSMIQVKTQIFDPPRGGGVMVLAASSARLR